MSGPRFSATRFGVKSSTSAGRGRRERHFVVYVANAASVPCNSQPCGCSAIGHRFQVVASAFPNNDEFQNLASGKKRAPCAAERSTASGDNLCALSKRISRMPQIGDNVLSPKVALLPFPGNYRVCGETLACCNAVRVCAIAANTRYSRGFFNAIVDLEHTYTSPSRGPL